MRRTPQADGGRVIERYEAVAVLDDAGKLQLENESDYRACLRKMKPGRKAVVIEDLKDTRTLRANRYYFGAVLRPLSDHTGYHPDELHEHFKKELLGAEKKTIQLQDEHGEVRFEGDIELVSTRKLTIREFYDYVERVRQIAAELGVVTEDPQEHR